MCGLIGFFVKKSHNKVDYQAKRAFMENGLILSCLRGWDATGIALVRQADKQPEVYKKAMPSPDFVNIKRTQRLLDNVDDCVAVLGHTRSATMRGATSDENAHPFQFDHITMIHNGHIPNYKQLKADCDIEVDSAHVAASLAQYGEKETLERVNGEYTFIWHNAKDKTINIAKNQGRPIHYARIPAWGGYVFASEFGMLAMLLDRHNIKIDDKIWRPQDLMHFKYDLDSKDMDGTMYPFLRPPTKYHGPPTRTTAKGNSTTTTVDIPKRQKTQRGVASVSYYDSEKLIGIGPVKTSNGNRIAIDRDLISRVIRVNAVRTMEQASDSIDDMNVTDQVKAGKRLNNFNMKFNLPYGVDFVDWVPYKDYPTTHSFGAVVGILTGSQFKGQVVEVPMITDGEFEAVDELGRFMQCRAWNVKSYVKNSKDDNRVIIMKIDDDILARIYREHELDVARGRRDDAKTLALTHQPNRVDLSKDNYNPPDKQTTITLKDEPESAGADSLYNGPKGSWITLQRWIDLCKDGCSYHQCKLDITQHRNIYWIDDCPICPRCANDNHEELLIPNAQYAQANSNG